MENSNDSIYLLLTNEKRTFLFKAKPIIRKDITTYKKKGNLDNAGFSLSISTDKLKDEKYALGIAIKKKDNQWSYQLINHLPLFELRKKATPLVLKEIPKATSKGKAIGNVEKVEQLSGRVLISGWAAIAKQDAKESVIKVVLSNSKKVYEIDTDKVFREDVTTNLKDGFDYNETGYSLILKSDEIIKGQYKISVSITDKNKTKAVFFSDKKLIFK